MLDKDEKNNIPYTNDYDSSSRVACLSEGV